MIYTVTGWFQITQHNNKRDIPITNLVETTYLYRYFIPMEIKYDQVSEFIGHELRKSLIEMEYRIVVKPITLGNPMSSLILERIHQVLGNLVRTCKISQIYFDMYDPWPGILAAAAFAIQSTKNRLRV